MYIKVGFNAGDGVNYYAVPGSMTDSMLNLPRMSNIGIPGQFVFRVDQTNITNAGLYLNIYYILNYQIYFIKPCVIHCIKTT